MKKTNKYITMGFYFYLTSLVIFGLISAVPYWTNLSHYEFVLATTNITPFKTIIFYIKAIFNETINIDIAIRNLFLPIIAFIPIGAYIYKNSGAPKGFYATIGVGATISFIMEVLQIALRRGTFDIDDVILSVVGITIAVVILNVARRCVKEQDAVS